MAAEHRRSLGRPPALANRAWTWLAIGGLIMLLGVITGRADAVRIGLIVWFALLALYVDALRIAVAVWRRQVGVRWLMPQLQMRVGDSVGSTIILGNRGPVPLPFIAIEPVAGQSLSLDAVGDSARHGANPGHSDTRFSVAVKARAFGAAHLHGVFLTLFDRLRLSLFRGERTRVFMVHEMFYILRHHIPSKYIVSVDCLCESIILWSSLL